MKAEEGSQREMGLPEDAEREARWMTLKVRKETRVRNVDGLQQPSFLQRARRSIFPQNLKKGTQLCRQTDFFPVESCQSSNLRNYRNQICVVLSH